MEAAEAEFGSLHYKSKIHTVLRLPYELATHPTVLDTVEALIGPNILLYDVEYIIKEPHAPSHVSWHQDLTYWGFSDDAQVSMWLALSPATAESGCMRMVPGSHKHGMRPHNPTDDPTNVLLHGQTISDLDESTAMHCPLQPGEASFHHGWTVHSSLPNRSDDRRIGLNVQYIVPHMRQIRTDGDTALLVRGTDAYGHYPSDIIAKTDFDPLVMEQRAKFEAMMKARNGSTA